MNETKKAKELLDKNGFEFANRIIDAMLDEELPKFRQDKIDYWLDVKNELNKLKANVR